MVRTVSIFLVLLALGVSHAAPGAALGQEGAAPAPVRLLVPAYFYPAGEGLAAWKRLIEASDRAPVVAIVNPDSGPGKKVDERYAALFRLARPSKLTMLGYVTLGYARRPISAVKAEIDSWIYFYPDVQGIFFDEQPSGAEQAAFALECFDHARRKIDRAVLVTNPGVPCAREYLAGADGPTACLFEHERGFEAYRPPDWADRFGDDRFAVLLYNVEAADRMREMLREAVRKRAGYLYLTDAPGPNPWGRLPSYWDEEVAEVSRGPTPPPQR